MNQHSSQNEQQKLHQSFKNFLMAESSRAQKEGTCVRCGAPVQFMDATFWLNGDDSGWNVRIPICSCAAAKPLEQRVA